MELEPIDSAPVDTKLDEVANLLVDSGAVEDESPEKVRKAYAPSGSNMDEVAEGFRQAADEINSRGRKKEHPETHDVEQSQYLPEEPEQQQAYHPTQPVSEQAIQNHYNWLQNEVAQLDQALADGIINQAQYQQGMVIAQSEANKIQKAMIDLEKSQIQLAKQQEAHFNNVNNHFAKHIEGWADPNTRDATINQVRNYAIQTFGVTPEVLDSLPPIPDLFIAAHKLMMESQRLAQIENKQLKRLQQQKQAKQQKAMARNNTQPAKGVTGMAQQTNAVARLLQAVGGA